MPGNTNLTANGITLAVTVAPAPPTAGARSINPAGYVTTTSGWDLVVGLRRQLDGHYTLSGGALVANLTSSSVSPARARSTTPAARTPSMPARSGFFSVGRIRRFATGTYNLSGTGALTVNADEYIGDSGTGIFNQTGGTNTIAAGKNLYLGFNASGVGNYNLSGGTVTVPATFVGYAGTGLLQVS